MKFSSIDIETLYNMNFDDFVNMQYTNCIKIVNNKVSLNNNLFDFIPAIPYDDFINMDFDNFSKIFDNYINNEIIKKNKTKK